MYGENQTAHKHKCLIPTIIKSNGELITWFATTGAEQSKSKAQTPLNTKVFQSQIRYKLSNQ